MKIKRDELGQNFETLFPVFLLTSYGKVSSLFLAACRNVGRNVGHVLKSDTKWQYMGLKMVQKL
jgi:hypothetical protein